MEHALVDIEQLVKKAGQGDSRALDALIRQVQPDIYRLALRYCWLPEDAEEATQEILVKIFTHLGEFRAEAKFGTWMYRIAINHLISMKRKLGEQRVQSFDSYASAINGCADSPLPTEAETGVEELVLAGEAKEACATGMLLCLDRDQRVALVLSLLEIPGQEAAEILEISAANYRQRLKRARADLKAFMFGQCGLVNPEAPCRCSKKTRAFVQSGVVDPKKLRFNPDHIKLVEDRVQEMSRQTGGWLHLFKVRDSIPIPDFAQAIRRILSTTTH